ncbi:MAG TPA: hypothetical protein VFB58_04035 [Chloroflexota bacterium]|nr:hypothetical protein [Chloroflexota bacterium]
MDDLDFEMVAASLRADTRDLTTFINVLADKLQGALPDRVMVRRGGGLFSRDKGVRSVAVDLGKTRYELEAERGRLTPRRATAVRGVTLKTEEIPLADWIDELSRELTEEAQRSEGARLALQRLLGA